MSRKITKVKVRKCNTVHLLTEEYLFTCGIDLAYFWLNTVEAFFSCKNSVLHNCFIKACECAIVDRREQVKVQKCSTALPLCLYCKALLWAYPSWHKGRGGVHPWQGLLREGTFLRASVPGQAGAQVSGKPLETNLTLAESVQTKSNWTVKELI